MSVPVDYAAMDEVRARLAEAAWVEAQRSSGPIGPKGVTGPAWARLVPAGWGDYGSVEARATPLAPPADAIERADEALRWLLVLTKAGREHERNAVWWRALGHEWGVIATTLRVSERTARRYEQAGLERIVRAISRGTRKDLTGIPAFGHTKPMG